MSQTAVYSISSTQGRLEHALAGLYREAQREARAKRSGRSRLDLVLACCNAATWLYTLTSLMTNV